MYLFAGWLSSTHFCWLSRKVRTCCASCITVFQRANKCRFLLLLACLFFNSLGYFNFSLGVKLLNFFKVLWELAVRYMHRTAGGIYTAIQCFFSSEIRLKNLKLKYRKTCYRYFCSGNCDFKKLQCILCILPLFPFRHVALFHRIINSVLIRLASNECVRQSEGLEHAQ